MIALSVVGWLAAQAGWPVSGEQSLGRPVRHRMRGLRLRGRQRVQTWRGSARQGVAESVRVAFAKIWWSPAVPHQRAGVALSSADERTGSRAGAAACLERPRNPGEGGRAGTAVLAVLMPVSSLCRWAMVACSGAGMRGGRRLEDVHVTDHRRARNASKDVAALSGPARSGERPGWRGLYGGRLSRHMWRSEWVWASRLTWRCICTIADCYRSGGLRG